MSLVFDSVFQFLKFVSKNPSHTVGTCLALPFDILPNISLWFPHFCYIYFIEFFIILYYFPESVIYFTYFVFIIREQHMFYYGYALQCVNPETYSTPTYLPWYFSYFMSISLEKNGHISQWIFLTQATYLFSLSQAVLYSEIEGFWSRGSCSLVFTPVWIWLYSVQDEFNRISKISRTSSSNWKLKVANHHPTDITQLKHSLSFLFLPSYFFPNT